MSSYNTLTVHQSEGVQFDDIQKLNDTLNDWNKCGVSELYSDYTDITGHKDWVGWIRLNNGEVEIAETVEHYFGGYGTHCVVYGCWYKNDAKAIADHMTAGKLVFHLEVEGCDDEYFVLTPGKVEEVSAGKIKF